MFMVFSVMGLIVSLILLWGLCLGDTDAHQVDC